MPTFKNEQQIQNWMRKVFSGVIENLSKYMDKTLNEYIISDVYEADYFPNYFYENGDGSFGSGYPSFEFEAAFRWKTPSSKNEIRRNLYYAWKNMTVDRYSGRHFEDGRDTRKELAEMLNTDDIVGHKKRRPYWDKFIAEMDLEFDRLFRKEVEKKKIKISHSEMLSSDYKEALRGMSKTINDFIYDNIGEFI